MPNEESLDLETTAEQLAALIAEKNLRIVFAESCTAGLVSATLAQVPGISQWHCGSAVTYRESTKTTWLAIPPSELEKHNAVSEPVARAMATGVLKITPEADIAASITGHLGPSAPPELDGVVFVAVARRHDNAKANIATHRAVLRSKQRNQRQREAALVVLQRVVDVLRIAPP